MRQIPGWVVGAAGVSVVVAAFFLGGRLAAEDRTPLSMASVSTAEPAAAPVTTRNPATLRTARADLTAAPAPLPTIVRESTVDRAAPAVRAASPSRTVVSRPRSTRKSVAIIAGSAAAGAAIGGLTKGKKAAVIGGLIGGGAATIWDQVTRRRAADRRENERR